MPDYQKKTVAELTEILKGRSLPHSGKKADLIARLNEADKTAEPSEAAPETVNAAEAAPETAAIVADGAEPLELSIEENTAATAPVAGSTSLAPQAASTVREGSATTDTKLASAVDYSMGLTTSSVDDELKRRKARAERFGTAATDETNTVAEGADAAAVRALERAQRFGTGQAADGSGVSKLDEALPMDRERKGKRGRDEGAYDDPGLKQGRGGKRRFPGRGGRGDARRGDRPEGIRKAGGGGFGDRDRAAAESRKKRFTAA